MRASPPALAVGNLTVDHVLTIRAPLASGMKYEVVKARHYFGGQAANAAYTMAALGTPVRLIAACGDDDLSREALEDLQRAGVDAAGVVRCPGSSLHSAVVIHEALSGERTILMRRPPGCELTAAALERAWPSHTGLVYLDGHEAQACERACELASRSRASLIVDVERCDSAFRPIVRQAHHVLASRTALLRLAPSRSAFAALAEVAPDAALSCATNGARRIAVIHGGERSFMKTVATKPVDSTGAGDAFRGAYAAAIHRGLTPCCALSFARKVGAAKCLYDGPRMPYSRLTAMKATLDALAAVPSA